MHYLMSLNILCIMILMASYYFIVWPYHNLYHKLPIVNIYFFKFNTIANIAVIIRSHVYF